MLKCNAIQEHERETQSYYKMVVIKTHKQFKKTAQLLVEVGNGGWEKLSNVDPNLQRQQWRRRQYIVYIRPSSQPIRAAQSVTSVKYINIQQQSNTSNRHY